MKIGLTLPHLGSVARRENIIRLAVDAEAEGIDSLLVAERLLWPLNHKHPINLLLMVFANFLSKCI